LTTGGSLAGFPTEPGVARPPVPGVLCPDGPVRLPGRPEVRLRQLFGRGVVVLVADRVDRGAVLAATMALTAAPVEVMDLRAIDVEGVLCDALATRSRLAHVVRPDGYLAAVLPGEPAAVAAAVARATGITAEAARAPGGPSAAAGPPPAAAEAAGMEVIR